jgi:hypothetical protein
MERHHMKLNKYVLTGLGAILAIIVLSAAPNFIQEKFNKDDYVFVNLGGGSKTLGRVIGQDGSTTYVITCNGSIFSTYTTLERSTFTCEDYRKLN